MLVAGPLAWLATAGATADEQVERHERAVARLAAERGHGRAATLERLRAARAANRDLLARVRDALLGSSSPGEVCRAGRRAAADPDERAARNVFAYLIRDWGGLPEGEREVGDLVAEVGRGLEACGAGTGVGTGAGSGKGSGTGTAVVLGAGAGRLASELCARFARVEAVEKSAITAAAFQLLRDGGEVHETNERNGRAAETIGRGVAVRTRPAAGLRYTVADALALPFADGSAAAVVSVFFTDVVPLEPLLAEVRRVLAPGGAFVHVGPLGYHFDAVEDMLSADELPGALGAAGFEVRREARLAGLHCASGARLAASWFESPSLAAVRRDDDRPIGNASVLALSGALRIATERIVTEAEERTEAAVVRLASGRSVEVGDVALALIDAVDGETPLATLLDRLEAAHGPLGRRAELVAMAANLVREGVLREV